jgi:hypothetical protein
MRGKLDWERLRAGGIRRFAGRSVLALVIVALAIGALMGWIRDVSNARSCKANLSKIYTALEQYEADYGRLPAMAYFPEDVLADSESLCRVLQPYGISPTNCVCRSTALPLRATGITYLWNTTASRTPFYELAPTDWLVTEINAMNDSVPAPHDGVYHVLYANGEIREQETPPVLR